eukprot:574077-Pelagomonas_calceolata.AAC.6
MGQAAERWLFAVNRLHCSLCSLQSKMQVEALVLGWRTLSGTFCTDGVTPALDQCTRPLGWRLHDACPNTPSGCTSNAFIFRHVVWLDKAVSAPNAMSAPYAL